MHEVGGSSPPAPTINEHMIYEHEVRVNHKCEFIPNSAKPSEGLEKEDYDGTDKL
jgi:hypothetical protein